MKTLIPQGHHFKTNLDAIIKIHLENRPEIALGKK